MVWKPLIIEPFSEWKLKRIEIENYIGTSGHYWCCWKALSKKYLTGFISHFFRAKVCKILIFEWIFLLMEKSNNGPIWVLDGKISWVLNVFTLRNLEILNSETVMNKDCVHTWANGTGYSSLNEDQVLWSFWEPWLYTHIYQNLFLLSFWEPWFYSPYISESRSFVCSSRTTGIYQNEVLWIVRYPRVRHERGTDVRTGWGPPGCSVSDTRPTRGGAFLRENCGVWVLGFAEFWVLCFCFCGKRIRGRWFCFVLFLYLVVAVELGSERFSSPSMSDDEDDAQEMVHYFFFSLFCSQKLKKA
jgi:hypothetical protein